jgi:phosphatidylserine synthase 2
MAIKDEFFIGHLLGWFAKTLIFRDVYMTSFLSVLFEIYEYSLQHILPNFAECWWDHV